MFKILFQLMVAGAALTATGGAIVRYSGGYYRALEAVGVHKREILVERVRGAQDEQVAATKQFESALEQFSALANFQGGDLQAAYDKAKGEYERSRARADEVHQRIDGVQAVGDALFEEWKGELGQYRNADLRRSSERQMEEVRIRYGQMLGAMRSAEKTLEPVLGTFHDQVLFLKHDLNAKAVASLNGNLADMRAGIATLIQEMETSISEAAHFVQQMSDRAGDPAP